MFPPTTTGRPPKRSLRELVREAVDTAAEFATLGEAGAPARHSAPGAPPPPRASTRTAGYSVVTRPQAPTRIGRASRTGLRHAGIPSPGAGDLTTAHRRPVWEDGHAGRAGASAPRGSTHLGRLWAARAPWAGQTSPPREHLLAARASRHDHTPGRGTPQCRSSPAVSRAPRARAARACGRRRWSRDRRGGRAA